MKKKCIAYGNYIEKLGEMTQRDCESVKRNGKQFQMFINIYQISTGYDIE